MGLLSHNYFTKTFPDYLILTEAPSFENVFIDVTVAANFRYVNGKSKTMATLEDNGDILGRDSTTPQLFPLCQRKYPSRKSSVKMKYYKNNDNFL